MESEQKIPLERFPATRLADVLFGAVSGAILGSIAALVTTQLLVRWLPSHPSILIGAIVGLVGGCIAGSIHHSGRTTFDDSELGVRMGITFAMIPSLILFLNALGVAGVRSVKLVVAVGFAGVMVGLILGSLLDRIYETILKRTTR